MRRSRKVRRALEAARQARAAKSNKHHEDDYVNHEGAINYMEQSDHDIELTSLDLRQEPDDDIEPPVVFRTDVPISPRIPTQNIVGAAFVAGVGYTQLKKIFQFADQKICASSTFYDAQKKIVPLIRLEVDKTVEAARELEEDNDDIQATLNSRWSSRRNGSQNTAAAISARTGKVIGYQHTIKYGGRREGNYEGPSNMMESSGLQAIANELHTAFPDKKAILTHDGDNKSKKIFADEGIEAIHEYDANHGRSALKRAFEPLKKELLLVHSIRRPFHGIEQRMITWASWLIENVRDSEKRVSMWLNSPNHLIGNHENCIHPEMMGRKPGRPTSKKKEKHQF